MILNLRTMSFQELVIFVTVVREGGIIAAADKLGIAKSAVSTQLARLEDRLKVKLLERSSRRMSLTVAGEHILPRVESLIAEGERLFEQAEQEIGEPAGTVKMAVTPDFGSLVVTHFFPEVNRSYPKISMISKFDYQFEDLQDPSFDIAIRIGKVNDENLVAHQLGEFKRILVASPEYLAVHPIKQPSDLEHAECIVFSSTTTERIWKLFLASNMEQPIPIPIKSNMAVLSFSAIIELALANQGIAYVPEFMAIRQIRAGTLQRVLPSYQGISSKVFLVYRFGSDKIHRLKSVIEIAKAHIPNLLKSHSC